jgi:hypothetical protein
MDLALVIVSLFLGIILWAAVAKVFTIAADVRRLVMLELCAQGAFPKAYGDAYRIRVAEKIRLPDSAIR